MYVHKLDIYINITHGFIFFFHEDLYDINFFLLLLVLRVVVYERSVVCYLMMCRQIFFSHLDIRNRTCLEVLYNVSFFSFHVLLHRYIKVTFIPFCV